jgi:hypothetical protein
MYEFTIKPKRNKHLCCYPPITHKMDINSPNLIYKFPCKIKLAMKINSSVGSSNHTQCYTVANQTLNAYGKWAGCPGGSGPGYSSTMRYVPYDNGSGLGPNIGGAICNCAYIAPQPPYLPVNIEGPIISGNTIVGSTLTLTGEGIWIGNPSPTLTFQWFRGGTPIINQTSFTYVTQTADVGQQITCRVTGTNSVGSVNAISNVITPILGPPQTITFTGTANFEIIYVNSLNQVETGPVLNGFTIYRVTSTSPGTTYLINSNSASTPISFLVIGGGGSGASNTFPTTTTGGGGAGGFIESSGTTNNATTYSIYVGRGGFLLNNTASGENSLLQLSSGTLTAIGGGGGGNFSTNLNGLAGGSGGGGAFNFNNTFGLGGNGTPGQGFPGGIGTSMSGSGGGAGGSPNTNSLNGGVGLPSTITGQSVYYAGGGGSVGRAGGIGGGGNGSLSQNVSGTPGTNGLGGGGGSGGVGAPGGDGVVILRIPSFI